MVSFDVESLFTNVPIETAVQAALRKLENDSDLANRTNLNLRSCLSHKLEFGLTIDIFPEENRAAIGSLVAAVVANIYMEEFEEQAIANATCKPKIWKGYVDDTFTVSDRDHVNGFLQHLNSQQPTIRFTMEIKK
ncbi:unnamed protein product, partial [Pocillopora meandrina]